MSVINKIKKKLTSFIHSLSPDHTSPLEMFGISIPRYRRLQRFFVLLASFVSLTPLLVLTAFYYHLDQNAIRSEVHHYVSQILSNTKRTLDFIIEERLAALSLIIDQESFERLSSSEELAFALTNLRESFGGFVDIGLINSDGNQSVYVGPYNLQGQNYSDQPWFHEVCLRGIYISEVFTGFRNFPHFIIAVKKEKKNGDLYVLRATIDLVMLDKQIHSSEYKTFYDAFLINKQGILQTESTAFGKVFGKFPLEIPKPSGSDETIKEIDENKKIAVIGFAYIEKSPFILVVMNQRSNPFEDWLSTHTDLLWFLSISCVLILIAIFLSSAYMVSRMQNAEVKRTKLLHNIEYTNKMATIGRMAAGVAHEINNPLAIVNEKAGLLKDIIRFEEHFPQRDRLLSCIESILKSVERGSKVTHRLLGFGRRLDTKHELLDLESLIQEVTGFISKEAEHRNISIYIMASEQVRPIESDRAQLQQVFLNLLNNAFAAVSNGGEINVNIDTPTSSEVKVSIKDNGTGISKDNLKHIFEPFYSTKGEFGTGLGLSITYEIIEKLGGDIQVNSVPGEGTTFTVTLPK